MPTHHAYRCMVIPSIRYGAVSFGCSVVVGAFQLPWALVRELAQAAPCELDKPRPALLLPWPTSRTAPFCRYFVHSSCLANQVWRC